MIKMCVPSSHRGVQLVDLMSLLPMPQIESLSYKGFSNCLGSVVPGLHVIFKNGYLKKKMHL
ncbi:hypothetical protein MAR_006989 [Mya arenaria]|uniref:Uncharacterized protein n=1 Tax=Mya arenaria TaxID=6604 RepID=A0ABY7DB59_MYAAR|nr:hypothetical protein MAR_006989 [Mya arenaria]